MAIGLQDLVTGQDFTALTTAGADDHNNIANAAITKDDGSDELGRGFIIVTTDTALDTPDVPDPDSVAEAAKWKRYLWCRRPHSTATDTTPILYLWNDEVTADATLLKWTAVNADVLTFQADLTAVEADVATAINTANTALANSSAALSTANSASSAATTAAGNAATALAQAEAAETDAALAQADADAAEVTAGQALTAAQNAVTVAGANKLVSQITPGTSGQKIQTNTAASASEWYSEINKYVKVSDTKANTTVAQSLASGSWVKRDITTEDNDAGALCAVASSVITLQPGVYKVHIVCPASSVELHQARLRNTTDGTTALLGTCMTATNGNDMVTNSIIIGIISITVEKNFEIQHQVSQAGVGGTACSFGESEVYTVAEFWKIN